MIDGLEPYQKMKHSGVPWLAEVPEHWQVLRLRNVADMRVSNVDKHSNDNEHPVRLCNYVDVYKNDYIHPNMPLMRATATRDQIARFRLAPGDVLITKDSEAWNDIGVPALVVETAHDLISGYHLALLRPFPDVHAGTYLFRALQSTCIAYQFHVEANGVTRYGLSHSTIKSVWLPVPPLPEQAAVVRFLDHADRRIRRYIRAKQKLIKLFEEQKQAIIHQAVTRGLDPSVKLRPSGVAWLGDVPIHWNVKRLKQTITPVEQGWSPQCDAQRAGIDEWGVLKVGCVNKESFDYSQNKRLPQALSPEPALEIQDGDILVSRANTRELLGLAALVEGPRSKLLLCDKLFRFRVQQDFLVPWFIVYLLRAKPSRVQIESSTNGASSSMQNIGQAVLRNLWVAIPPLDEQEAICARIRVETGHLTIAIAHAQREIDLLREFRTRLIADVVTGKLDVREAAARLPDDVEEPDPIEEAEETLEEADLDEAALETGA